jgi:uncharacterized protein (TIGR02453 family)
MKIDDVLQFLSELTINNNREWFAENKDRYDRLRLGFEQLGRDLILEISKFDDEIKHVEVKDCVFRIYRDTRFSHDKTPYKTHMGIFIATAGGRKSQRGGYYLHLDPAGSFVAAGVWCPDANLLKALRQSVYDNIEEMNEIRFNPDFAKYFNSFYEDDKLKTVPRGFPKDFADAELLKLKHYMVEYKLDKTILGADDFVARVGAILQCAYPLNQFLNYTVDEVANN